MVALLVVDVLELKSRLTKRLGKSAVDEYLRHLHCLLNKKITKLEFDKLCCGTIGKENLPLHNLLIRALIGNGFLAARAQGGQANSTTVTGQSRTINAPLLPSHKIRSNGNRRNPSISCARVKSPLGHGTENTGSCNQGKPREDSEFLETRSPGSKVPLEVISVEDGEEAVSSSPCVQSGSPITAPLGTWRTGTTAIEQAILPLKRKSSLCCYMARELHETATLYKVLRTRLEAEGIDVSIECANFVNRALDLFLKRLIEPAVALAKARRAERYINWAGARDSVELGVGCKTIWQDAGSDEPVSTSLQDYLVAMEANPHLLGFSWPAHLENIRQCTE